MSNASVVTFPRAPKVVSKVITDWSRVLDMARALAILPDRRIVAADTAYVSDFRRPPWYTSMVTLPSTLNVTSSAPSGTTATPKVVASRAMTDTDMKRVDAVAVLIFLLSVSF